MANSKCLDVEFNGIIQAETRAELLKELVKYILYQRSQIPMYFDQIKESIKQQTKLHSGQSSGGRVAVTTRDQQSLVESVECLFETIHNVFSSGEPIKQVLIILGSTIVTPKDSYLLSFPVDFYEGPTLSRQACVTTMFRTLYDCDFLAKAKAMNSCTNLHVMFLAARNSDLQRWKLVPKLSYRVPVIGTCYTVNIIYRPDSVTLGNAKLDLVGDELDISGIRPLDDSLSTFGSVKQTVDHCSESVTHCSDEADCVWFQAPVHVKGYKEKIADCTGSMWGAS